MGDCRAKNESPVKACLIAPTFNANNASSSSPAHKEKASGKTSRSAAKAATNNRKSTGAHSSIDDAVRKVYNKVTKKRDLKRKKLVSSVLRESRDEVIYEILGNEIKNIPGINNGMTSASGDTKFNDDDDEKDEKKRYNVAVKGTATSPHTKKKSRKKPTLINIPGMNSGKTSASNDTKWNNDDHEKDGKKRHIVGVNGVNGTATSPHAKKKSRRNPTPINIAEEKKDDSDVCAYDDERNEHEKSSNGNGNHDGGTKSIIKTNLPQLGDDSNHQSSLRTLVFPRLPSNNGCPSYQVFSPTLCQRCHEEDTVNNNESIKMAVPPNVSKPKNDHPEYPLTIQSRGQKCNQTATTTTSTHQPLLIEGAHPPRPKCSSLIFLKSALGVDDEPSLAHIPYLGDGDNEDIYSELFDTKQRERLYEFGPPYQEKETLDTVDEVLRLMAVKRPKLFDSKELLEEAIANGVADGGEERVKAKGVRSDDVEKLARIHLVLSELASVDIERVHERHSYCFMPADGKADKPKASSSEDDEPSNSKKTAPSPKKNANTSVAVPYESITDSYRDLLCGLSSSSEEDEQPSNSKNIIAPSLKKNSDTPVAVPYESIMDSYRDLFCRRCFTYDCNIHGNLPKANLDLLGELAVQKELDGHWKELDNDIALDNISNNGKRKEDNNDELTPAQQSICKRAYSIFQGDIDKVALTIGAMPATVNAFVKSKKIKLCPTKFITTQLPIKKPNRSYASMKNYNQKWLRHIQSKVILPAFLPCDHDGPCNDDCSCVTNGFFCTKACGWGSKSPNFFRGCQCPGQCRSNSCPCYAANRECDPDLCRTCGACADSPEAPATGEGQRCRNDNISMRRHCHLLIAESNIKEAGWGLFTKHTLKRGDFVHEYVGEIISQEEAERRGVIYDKLNMSYLFNLSSDLVVDATRKGNKARYANHSSTPNIEPKMITVNGDIKIGFYAKHDIDAQSELFFDYRYDEQIDNELIFKPDHSVNFDWMYKENNKGQKKNP